MQMVKDTIDTDKLKKGRCGLPLFSQHIHHKRLCKDEEQHHAWKDNERTGWYDLPVTPFHPFGSISCFRKHGLGDLLSDRNQIFAGKISNILCLSIESDCSCSKELPD